MIGLRLGGNPGMGQDPGFRDGATYREWWNEPEVPADAAGCGVPPLASGRVSRVGDGACSSDHSGLAVGLGECGPPTVTRSDSDFAVALGREIWGGETA